jgi:hypothetical protein
MFWLAVTGPTVRGLAVEITMPPTVQFWKE